MNRNYLPEVFFMISRKTDKFTGFVLDGEKKYPFYSSDRVFHFISEGVGIFADAVKNRVSTPDAVLSESL